MEFRLAGSEAGITSGGGDVDVIGRTTGMVENNGGVGLNGSSRITSGGEGSVTVTGIGEGSIQGPGAINIGVLMQDDKESDHVGRAGDRNRLRARGGRFRHR
ncbi:hypothetical protein TA3x_005206 [Tundrisphaera sp. TA3]|uniref:hypothetical protein n=1 Tax=Tundrisphaera sp. TA3 TaxID=3435775 RepID=UPI003EBA8415